MTNPGMINASGLSAEESAIVAKLVREIESRKFWLELRNAYYNGQFKVQDLGISIPPQLRNLKTVMGWARIAVDSLEERLDVEGFRYPGASDADEDLQKIWQANNLDEEAPLGHLDAMIFGHSFIAVGAPADDGSDTPLITVESPLNMGIDWDPRTKKATSALRIYTPGWINADPGDKGATLYTPDATVTLLIGANGQWEVVSRDDHGLGEVTVVRVSNRQRTADRVGSSEITPELMSVTDAACRTLLGLEVAREFYSAPQRAILGVTESAFQNPDGTMKTAWETYLGRVLALERDEEGNLPQIHEMKAYDPSVYTNVIDMYAQIVMSYTGLPPHYLGYNSHNPASADAIRSSEARLVRRVKRKQQAFSGPWEQAMRFALLIRDGSIPDDANNLETVWSEPGTPTIAETSDAITKQIQVGAIPATSDVTLERLGYSFAERERLEVDRSQDLGAQLLAELATSIQAKEARVDKTIASDINPDAAKGAPVVDPNTGAATVNPSSGASGPTKPAKP